MAGQRRKARIIALKALYEMDTVAHQPGDILARLLEEASAPPDVETFARSLVTGVLNNRDEIDEIIRQKAPAWPLEQGAVVDRNILRLAIFEILLDNILPVRGDIKH